MRLFDFTPHLDVETSDFRTSLQLIVVAPHLGIYWIHKGLEHGLSRSHVACEGRRENFLIPNTAPLDSNNLSVQECRNDEVNALNARRKTVDPAASTWATMVSRTATKDTSNPR